MKVNAVGGRTFARRAIHAALATAAVLFLAGAFTQPALAGAQKGTRVAWGYSDPNGYICQNGCFSNKGVTGITQLGTGSYQITMSRLYAPGPSDLQISSEGSTPPFSCMTSGWSNGYNETVDALVNCYDLNGNPADANFSFLYQSRDASFGSSDKGIAFLWADQPTEASYTPNLGYQYNSTGATNTMVRNATGSYTALLPGLTKKGGNVQVTAYGNGPARCVTSGWSSSGAGTSVNVLCFDGTGAAADEMFTLAYTIGEPLGLFSTRRLGDTGAYAWADKPANTKTYKPARAYNYNGFKTGELSVQRTAQGSYSVTVPDVVNQAEGVAVLVTANGGSNVFCATGNLTEAWNPFQVFCYDQNGNPADSKFSALLQTDEITK